MHCTNAACQKALYFLFDIFSRLLLSFSHLNDFADFFLLRSAMLRFKLFSICYMHVKTNVYSCTRCPIISSLSLSCTMPKRMTQSEPWTTRQHAANMFSFNQSIYSDRRLRVAGFRFKTDHRCENLIRNILKMREKRCTHCNDNGLISTAT